MRFDAAGSDFGPAAPSTDALDTGLNRALVFGLGLLLPLLTLTRNYIGTPMDFASRVVPVDLVCAVFLPLVFVRHGLRALPLSGTLYLAAIFLSLVIALAISAGPPGPTFVGFAAVLMAFAFYVAGLQIGESPALLRWLLAGAAAGVLAEATIVAHDTVAAAQWFPDPMDGRVRGTFRANGQLGAFGFCAGGLLLTFAPVLESRWLRRICIAAGIAAVAFVFPASRRAGMVAVFLWAGLVLLMGWRFARRPAYRIFLGSVIALAAAAIFCWDEISSSFVGRRLLGAVADFETGEGFIANQFRDVLASADRWFPFGFGVAHGYLINARDFHEVHNCFLAVAVEFGILGFAGFLGLVSLPLVHARRGPRVPGTPVLRLILVTFMLACIVFMFHNTLFRDRTFLLFLGIATAWVRTPGRRAAALPVRDFIPRRIETVPDAPAPDERETLPPTVPEPALADAATRPPA